MAQETERSEVTPSTWEQILAKCYGGMPCGELTILMAKTGAGKSVLAQQLTEQNTNGVR